LENPTPAVDVFLLGSLLWCMVSGRPRLYGERYKHDAFNLKKIFPENRWMRLINLVLSQCPGADENECVKSANEILTIVDEVLSTMTRNSPIFDENNTLVIPCRFCSKGFCYKLAKSAGQGLRFNLSIHDENSVHSHVVSLDIFQCTACSTIEFSSPGQPNQVMMKELSSRINPGASKSPTTW
jgi:hypothetical protein